MHDVIMFQQSHLHSALKTNVKNTYLIVIVSLSAGGCMHRKPGEQDSRHWLQWNAQRL